MKGRTTYSEEQSGYTAFMMNFDQLRHTLPSISFLPAHDAGQEAARAYCSHYRLDTLPGQHRLGTLPLADVPLVAQYWLPDTPARHTVLLVHGYYEHLALELPLIRHCLQRGWAVLGVDLPGHGLSGGPRACIDTFDRYGDAIAAVSTAAAPHLPALTHAIGHSTGCAALMNSLMRAHALPFTQLVLLAPLLRPHRWQTEGRFLYAALHRFIPSLPRHFSTNSHDPAFLTFCRYQDPLQVNRLSVQWVGAMKHWLDHFRTQSPITLPTLLVQGTDDTTVDWRYNIPALLQKLPNGRAEYLPDARHQLINESPPFNAALWPLLDTVMEQHH